MPWKETCAMKERLKMASLFETGDYTVTELAERFKISRKTAYKWLARYADEGLPGLEERSRAPHRRPRTTPAGVVLAVIRAKKAHPTWGPAKLSPCPDEAPEIFEVWPAVSTRGRILDMHGLVNRRRGRRKMKPWHQPFLAADQPNEVWSADFKGWFRTRDGTRCDPVTITDAYSRMLLCCDILPKPDYAHTRPVIERVFREYGLPVAIRTDNGPPFASIAIGGLSPLSVWWIRLGIIPERIQPGHPEQNGRHERMHSTLKQDTMKPPAENPEAQQERCDRFRSIYNNVRPHEALGQIPPARFYSRSPRPYPGRLPEIEYPPLAEVRRVRSNGQIKWRGGRVFTSEVLIGELVGITEDKDGWLVSYGPIPLGLIHPNRSVLSPLPQNYHSSSRRIVTDVFS